MIPIHDNIRARHFPLVNTVLIIINLIFVFFEASIGTESLQNLIVNNGLVPSDF